MKLELPTPSSPPAEITLDTVRAKILTIRDKAVLLDSDVAALYAVQTKEVNQAIQRNPDKFPPGYLIQLTKDEWKTLRSQIATLVNPEPVANPGQSTGKEIQRSQIVTFDILDKQPVIPKYPPTALTEKALYMLATILKSPRATATTIAIVEAFARLRELSSAVADLVQSPADPQKQATVMQKSSQILSDMVTKELQTTGTETSFELNLFSAVKLKHTIKKELKHQKTK